MEAFSAQAVAGPSVSTQGSNASAGGKASEEQFLAGIVDDAYREAMEEIFASARQLGFVLAWGSKGTSIRVRTPDRTEPLSVGWAFLAGDQWYGARHLSLGVDGVSLKAAPTVAPAIAAFTAAVRAISGASPVPTTLEAWTFPPSAVPPAKAEILAALEGLAEAIQESDSTGG